MFLKGSNACLRFPFFEPFQHNFVFNLDENRILKMFITFFLMSDPPSVRNNESYVKISIYVNDNILGNVILHLPIASYIHDYLRCQHPSKECEPPSLRVIVVKDHIPRRHRLEPIELIPGVL